MERSKVYEIIDGERDFQKSRWTDDTHDRMNSTADWILYMEKHLNDAKANLYNLNEQAALAEMRKVTALGIACFEMKGCPVRKQKS